MVRIDGGYLLVDNYRKESMKASMAVAKRSEVLDTFVV